MAESLRAKFEEHLSCAICLERFQDPRVLPCLHSYCLKCIARLDMTGNTLTCPECRVTVKVPFPPDVSFLPSNFFANNLLDTLLLANDSAAGNITCENCDSGDGAETRCEQCATYLCHFCTEAHRRSRKMKSHDLKSLEELKEVEPPTVAKILYCSKHEEERVKLYCRTCQETICRDCTIREHRRHDYVCVQDVAEEKKSELLKLLEDVKQHKNEISTSLVDLKRQEERLNNNNKATIEEIESHFGDLVAVLVNKKEEFISQVKISKDAKLKQLHTRQDELEFLLANCESNIEFTEQAIQNGNDVQLLNLTKYILDSLESQKVKKSSVEDSVAGEVAFEAKLTKESLTSHVLQNCFVRDMNGDEKTSGFIHVATSDGRKLSTIAECKTSQVRGKIQESKTSKEALDNRNTGLSSTSKEAATRVTHYISSSSKPVEVHVVSGAVRVSTIPFFPRGSQVGDHIFRYGYHTWSVEIDHSECPGFGRTYFEIGVISHVDGSTVAFSGFVKAGCAEDLDLELDSEEENLSVAPSWNGYDSIDFDVYSNRLAPYLKNECQDCYITITDQSFYWQFKEY